MTKNETYAGFTVLDVVTLNELGAVGIWLKHTVTGMEVYHVLNDDEENLFAFAFKTPPSDSTGVAHILEHSVLCGSKNFPLKDPFLQLSNQSVKTFLNAMTFPDKTVYPASSMVEADYFNLFAVYGDAVFFPLLEEWVFKQEAYRLEKDKNGTISLQGVVYNEMKGNYSSPESIAAEWALRSILPNTVYAHDSGGDPSFIPELTYEAFKQFHADYYHPTNCRLFLCGNIETKKQLDFINERFLKHFSSANKKAHTVIDLAKPFEKPIVIETPAPATKEEKGSNIIVNWLLGDAADAIAAAEANFLGEILLGHDGSVLTKALLESGLGEDLSPNSGLEVEIRQLAFTAGLRGAKKSNAQKIEKVIFDVLEHVAKNGVPQEEIDAACMSIEFANREVRRSSGGPFSLTLMRRALRYWLHGKRPDEAFFARSHFALIKERLKNPQYIQNLCKNLLIQNNHRSLLIVYPDKNYESRFAKQEQILISNLLKKSAPFVHEEMLKKQQESESPEKLKLLPHLKPENLTAHIDIIETKTAYIHNIPVYTHTENTNGICYVDMGIPVDVLEAKDYLFLPFFSGVITSVGFNGKNWVEASSYSAQITGGFGASLFTSSCVQKTQNGRSWLFFRIKMLEEKTAQAIQMLFDTVQKPDFSDKKRIKDLVLEFRNDFDSSIIPSGHQYAASRATRTFSRSKAIDEIWNGITQLYFAHTLAKMNAKTLESNLLRIHQKLLKSGLVLNITATKSGIESALKTIGQYLQNFCAPVKELNLPDTDFFELTQAEFFAKSKSQKEPHTESFITATQVGFAGMGLQAHQAFSQESVHEAVLAHRLSNSALWEQIRTIGGAYGAFAYPDSMENVFVFATYRDPKPENSLNTFVSCLQEAAENPIDNDSLEKAITGSYSKEIQPRSPSNRGFTGFIRTLYGITDELREQKIKTLLKTTPEQLQTAARFLQEKAKTAQKTVITGTAKNGIRLP